MVGVPKILNLTVVYAGQVLMKCCAVSFSVPHCSQVASVVGSLLLRLFLSQFWPEHM